MIKLIVCDIDGTLLGKDENSIKPEIAKQLDRLSKSGKTIAFASGRSYYGMRKIASSLSCADDIYYICNDGALCIYRGKTLYHKQISIENILRFSRNPDYENLPIMYFSDTYSYVTGTTPQFIDKLESEGIDTLDPISGVYDIKNPIYKIGIYGLDGKDPDPLLPAPFDMRICYRSNKWLEYTSRFANKGLAVSDLQMRLYMSKFDTAAFGDGDNDIEMFSKAKYTYARRGGSEALCRCACEQFDDIAYIFENID